MRRRSRVDGKPVKTRRRKAATPQRPGAPKVGGRRKRSSTDANSETALLRREWDELLEQQKATAEVLRLISASSGDLQRVFAAILENATRLCQANFGTLLLCEGDFYRQVAFHNAPPAFVEARRLNPMISMSGSTALARLAATKRPVHIADVASDPAYQIDSQRRRFAALTGVRTNLAVPMLIDDKLTGALNIYRTEVRPFTDKQIALVQNFAAQALIAIENTQLLNELRQRTDDLSESLEQQTATSEVLSVISSSPGELEPVFQAVLEKKSNAHLRGEFWNSISLRRWRGSPRRFAWSTAGPRGIHAECAQARTAFRHGSRNADWTGNPYSRCPRGKGLSRRRSDAGIRCR
jgi:transcriptional regulator with GAF, ATPase, and Fis domain